MKLFAGVLSLSIGIASFALFNPIAFGQTSTTPSIEGTWQGFATARGGQQVPISIGISGSGSHLRVAFLNGPANHPDATSASSATLDGTHLVASFDYFARTLDGTIHDGVLTGTYGSDACWRY